MSEPMVPEPPPESGSHWDPAPARCPECGQIVGAHPASRADESWEGWCSIHGTVLVVYPDGNDFDEEEEEA
jgi:hypothetical protein